MTLTLIPVLLGSGLRCFGGVPQDIHWRLVRSRAYDFGYVPLTYARESDRED